MPQPILEIKPDKAATRKTKPHLLPCRIHHSGRIGPTQSFWTPSEVKDGKSTAYFRGRKLNGRVVKLPDGYRGVVAERLESKGEQAPKDAPEVIDVDAEDEVDMGVIQTQGEFDEMMIWDYEATADAATDHYVRSIEEWLGVAEQVHSYPPVLKGEGS